MKLFQSRGVGIATGRVQPQMMNIRDVDGRRFELALQRLLDGHAFKFQGVTFWLAPDTHLDVSVDSDWSLENLTTDRALAEIGRAESIYRTLCHESAQFVGMTQNHQPRFILTYDYGNGSVELARLEQRRLSWAKGLIPPA